MTYLELVNGVLRRLRDEEIATVAQTPYSRLIGDFVNDAKGIVESAWDWSALRTTLTVNTISDIFNYALVDSRNKLKILDVVNDTSDVFVEQRSSTWFNNKYLIQPVLTGSLQYYTFNGVDSNGDTQVDLYPMPDGVYAIRFNCVRRNLDLVNDADDLLIPSQPVLHLAVALAARERGETGGTSAPEYFSIADRYLSDAIQLDAQKHPNETIWYNP